MHEKLPTPAWEKDDLHWSETSTLHAQLSPTQIEAISSLSLVHPFAFSALNDGRRMLGFEQHFAASLVRGFNIELPTYSRYTSAMRRLLETDYAKRIHQKWRPDLVYGSMYVRDLLQNFWGNLETEPEKIEERLDWRLPFWKELKDSVRFEQFVAMHQAGLVESRKCDEDVTELPMSQEETMWRVLLMEQAELSSDLDLVRKLAGEVVWGNHLLVMQYAQRKNLYARLPREEVFQHGCHSLLYSLQRYDWTRGVAFSTFATNFFPLYFKRETEKSIRAQTGVSINRQSWLRRYNQACLSLEDKLKRRPSDDEVASYLGISTGRIRKLSETHLLRTVSVNASSPLTDQTLLDVIPDNASEEALRSVEDMDLRAVMEEVMKEVLKGRDWEMIKYRYGWEDGRFKSYRETGKNFGISRQRAHQIHQRIRERLRPELARRLSVTED